MFVNLLVDNERALRRSTRSSSNSLQRDGQRAPAGASDCDELQDYIDAQNGGPGKGWFRIVTDPFQARR